MDIQLAKRMSEQLLIQNAYQKKSNLETAKSYNMDQELYEVYVTITASKILNYTNKKTNDNIGVDFKWMTCINKGLPINDDMSHCHIRHLK